MAAVMCLKIIPIFDHQQRTCDSKHLHLDSNLPYLRPLHILALTAKLTVVDAVGVQIGLGEVVKSGKLQ